ncbi:MAG: hypothetical protein U5L02_18820 [Rheinheimera sp.]|nr:hypothetical protein [Rheinheimera sp.]
MIKNVDQFSMQITGGSGSVPGANQQLFVLSQLRALALGKERITPGLMRQVYKDELKPVHPMLEALRSGVPEKIAQYSDLMLPEMDKRLIQLQRDIAGMKVETPEELALKQLATDDERGGG